MYLVDTNEAQTQGGQHLNYSRATVALDWEIGLQPWRDVLPAHMLTHQRTQVSHHKCSLIHLIDTGGKKMSGGDHRYIQIWLTADNLGNISLEHGFKSLLPN